MNVNLFITQRDIRPADAIVLNKKFFGMLDHYVIYLGVKNFQHQFVANYVDGVKIVPTDKIDSLLQVYVPTKVERFSGTAHQRSAAIKRAFSRIGERAYNLVSNNCEHFKNFVHQGIDTSTQVEKAAAGLTLGGIGLTLIGAGRKNSTAIAWGIVILIVGIIVGMFATRDPKEGNNNN
jgi:Lecithin retinol acyltransferase